MITVDGVEMIDVREAAALAGRNPETVRRWVWSGRLTARRDGNRLLLPRTEVLALLHPDDGGAPQDGSALAAWAGRARRSQSGGRRGVSAVDVLLDDRRARAARGRFRAGR